MSTRMVTSLIEEAALPLHNALRELVQELKAQREAIEALRCAVTSLRVDLDVQKATQQRAGENRPRRSWPFVWPDTL